MSMFAGPWGIRSASEKMIRQGAVYVWPLQDCVYQIGNSVVYLVEEIVVSSLNFCCLRNRTWVFSLNIYVSFLKRV